MIMASLFKSQFQRSAFPLAGLLRPNNCNYQNMIFNSLMSQQQRHFSVAQQVQTNATEPQQNIEVEVPKKAKKVKSVQAQPDKVVTLYQFWIMKGIKINQEKRNTFYKLGYNENHIPNQKGYEKNRKQRLDQWDNPPQNWPPFLPRPTMHKGKTLLKEVEREYINQIVTSRPFKVPAYRTGDVVDVTMFKSLSEGKFHKFRGVIFGTMQQNSINKSFKFHFNEDEMNSLVVKEFSPMVAKIELHRYGSNQLRAKLNHIPQMDLSKSRTAEPIIKGRGYKSREAKKMPAKEASLDSDRGKIKRNTAKLEKKYE